MRRTSLAKNWAVLRFDRRAAASRVVEETSMQTARVAPGNRSNSNWSSPLASSNASVLGHALAHMVEPPRRSNGSLKVKDFSSPAIARPLKEIYTELAAS